jgi:hypothetical protein
MRVVDVTEEARRMMALFEGFDSAHGTHGKTEQSIEKGGKLEIKKSARTVREPVTIDLWTDHIAGERPLGIIPIRRDNTCRWGCVDVDRYDLDHGEIVRRLRDAVLSLVVCRTKSGGAHIFMFTSEPVAAEIMRSRLSQVAAFLGYGGSEIFPKQSTVLLENGDLGNWLNMPYLSGDQTERYAVNETGRGLTLRQFLARAEAARMSQEDILAMQTTREEAQSEWGDGPPCIEHLASTGFPEGTRNNGLFAVGTMLKRKFPDKWEERLEQANQRLLDPPLPTAEVGQILKSLRTKDYRYKCSDQPLAGHCNSALCRVRKFGVGSSGSLPTMSSLAVLDTDEPVWFMDVGGHRIELTTDELQNPARFQKKCMEAIHVVVPIPKRETWQNIIQGLMENVTKIEAPGEISVAGQFHEHLEAFCTDRQRARDRDEILLGKAWLDEESGRVYFRIRDVQEHLDKVKFRQLSRSQMTMQIKKLGGGTHFFNIKGRGVNVFWCPIEAFSIQTEPHDLPHVQEDVV